MECANLSLDISNNTSHEADFFHGLTSPKPIRTFSLTLASSVCVISPIFLLFIVWFERFKSDKKRTILNMITSHASLTAMEYILIIQGQILFSVLQYLKAIVKNFMKLEEIWLDDFFLTNLS